MPHKPDDKFLNQVGNDRIASRQVDELVGIARGIIADGEVSVGEVEYLQKWLAANQAINDQPLLRDLGRRVREVLADGAVDKDERLDLLSVLQSLASSTIELGEVLKATTLPLTKPEPNLSFAGQLYCFTGTFMFGQRKVCEKAVAERGGSCASLTRKTNVLVIGTYATESWKHSSFGEKIMRASEWRERGLPIAIVAEAHWKSWLDRITPVDTAATP